jgi:hypothetical protein
VAAPRPTPSPAERRRQGIVVVGLLLTFLGLFLASRLLPTDPGALTALLPAAAAGLVALWLGGILLGNSVRPFGRRRR